MKIDRAARGRAGAALASVVSAAEIRTIAPVKVTPKVKIWDPFVRLFHWALASCFLFNFLELTRPGKLPHRVFGYVAIGLVLARFVWGFVGSKHARFADFVRSPRIVLDHIRDMLIHRDRRCLGHNPAGGAMVVALMTAILIAGVTGWLQTTDAFFGIDWVEKVHEIMSSLTMALVSAHLLGVLHAGWRHRENLPLAMLTGRKRL